MNGHGQSYKTEYEPFGKLRLESNSSGITPTPKFTGKETDVGLDLDYFDARYYDADFGVWISPDPMRQFASPYAYSPNPINSVDPDGNYFSDASSCADGASNLIDYRQGSIGGPSNLAFDRGFERLYNNASALSSTQQIAAWTAESGLEAGFRFDGPMRYSIYTNGEEGGIDSRVAEGPIGAAFMHSHPSWGGLGLSGMDGDLYFAQIHPEYAIHSGTGRVFYSDRKLANLGLSVELPRLSVPSSSAPGFQPQVKSPR